MTSGQIFGYCLLVWVIAVGVGVILSVFRDRKPYKPRLRVVDVQARRKR